MPGFISCLRKKIKKKWATYKGPQFPGPYPTASNSLEKRTHQTGYRLMLLLDMPMAVMIRPTLTPGFMKMAFGSSRPSTVSSSAVSFAAAKSSNAPQSPGIHGNRKLPILLFDIMDTIVRDPFYEDVPAFFGMSLKELIDCKHPTSWIEFEKGLIDEMELARKFFKDGRPLDLEGLKTCLKNKYSYIEGVEKLLSELKQNNYEMHAFTNYPIWYEMIEEKLKISEYLSWTFCSCTSGRRKPDPDFFLDSVRHLEVDPSDCIFIDDRMKNVVAASEIGIVGLQFTSADLLRRDLSGLGVDI